MQSKFRKGAALQHELAALLFGLVANDFRFSDGMEMRNTLNWSSKPDQPAPRFALQFQLAQFLLHIANRHFFPAHEFHAGRAEECWRGFMVPKLRSLLQRTLHLPLFCSAR